MKFLIVFYHFLGELYVIPNMLCRITRTAPLYGQLRMASYVWPGYLHHETVFILRKTFYTCGICPYGIVCRLVSHSLVYPLST